MSRTFIHMHIGTHMSGDTTHFNLSRRAFTGLCGAMGAVPAVALGPHARPEPRTTATRPRNLPLADLHTHLGLIPASRRPAEMMAAVHAHGVNLGVLKLVADQTWIGYNEERTNVTQLKKPEPGQVWALFESTMQRVRSAMALAKPTTVQAIASQSDLTRAVGGTPSLLLGCEGSDFLEGDLLRLAVAVKRGLRMVGLVHYSPNPAGDFQTEAPSHGGLTPWGLELVQALEAQQVVVDLAHCTPQGIAQALAVAKKPVVWSHGWVGARAGRPEDPFGFVKRRLSTASAKAIADRGGVIGMWALGLDRPGMGWPVKVNDLAGLAAEAVRHMSMVGEDHAALGTDMGGLGRLAALNHYGDVRQLLDIMASLGVRERALEKFAWENAVRVWRACLPSG